MSQNKHLDNAAENCGQALDDDALMDAAGGAQQAKTRNEPGLFCPKCNAFIPTTIYDLLYSPHIRCPECDLVLSVDKVKA